MPEDLDELDEAIHALQTRIDCLAAVDNTVSCCCFTLLLLVVVVVLLLLILLLLLLVPLLLQLFEAIHALQTRIDCLAAVDNIVSCFTLLLLVVVVLLLLLLL